MRNTDGPAGSSYVYGYCIVVFISFHFWSPSPSPPLATTVSRTSGRLTRVNGGTRTFTRRPKVPNERATSERTVVFRLVKMMTPIRPLLCVLLLVGAVLESTHGRGQTYLEPGIDVLFRFFPFNVFVSVSTQNFSFKIHFIAFEISTKSSVPEQLEPRFHEPEPTSIRVRRPGANFAPG